VCGCWPSRCESAYESEIREQSLPDVSAVRESGVPDLNKMQVRPAR
jgi:hypothetical protein